MQKKYRIFEISPGGEIVLHPRIDFETEKEAEDYISKMILGNPFGYNTLRYTILSVYTN